MQVSFDPAKSERNAAERGLPFELAAEFDFETALIDEDDRRDYGETRYLAFGRIGERLHALCFTRVADGIRVSAFVRRMQERSGVMKKHEPLTNEEGEVRELLDEDFARMKRFHELPEDMQATLRAVRGKQKAPTKELISLRVSRDVLGRFRATGQGWQRRMDEALRDWIERREAKGG